MQIENIDVNRIDVNWNWKKCATIEIDDWFLCGRKFV